MTEYEEIKRDIILLIEDSQSHFTSTWLVTEQIMSLLKHRLIDHYWDTVENHRDILELHIKRLLNTAIPNDAHSQRYGKG